MCGCAPAALLHIYYKRIQYMTVPMFVGSLSTLAHSCILQNRLYQRVRQQERTSRASCARHCHRRQLYSYLYRLHVLYRISNIIDVMLSSSVHSYMYLLTENDISRVECDAALYFTLVVNAVVVGQRASERGRPPRGVSVGFQMH